MKASVFAAAADPVSQSVRHEVGHFHAETMTVWGVSAWYQFRNEDFIRVSLCIETAV